MIGDIGNAALEKLLIVLSLPLPETECVLQEQEYIPRTFASLGGVIGKTCQILIPESDIKSTKVKASGPSFPDGNEVI